MEHLVRSHVERCLQDIWGVWHLPVDDEGDYPFRAGVAACWVHVDTQLPVLVRVFGHAVVDVKRSAGLLRELNDLNSRSRTTSVAWDATVGGVTVGAGHGSGSGVVRVSTMVHPDALGRRSLRHALDAVASVSNDLGPMVAGVFGGTTPYAVPRADDEVEGEA
jgi:hypothetical protein